MNKGKISFVRKENVSKAGFIKGKRSNKMPKSSSASLNNKKIAGTKSKKDLKKEAIKNIKPINIKAKTAADEAEKRSARIGTSKGNITQLKKSGLNKEAVKSERADKVKKGRKGLVLSVPSEKDARNAINALLSDEFAVEYMRKNVSKNVTEVIKELALPKDDEYIAAKLGVKSNVIRRVLNILQGYGITNYYVSKNVNGWLSFAWYININKIPSFFGYIKSKKSEEVITENCNDYFICNKCYDTDKLIFTFEEAAESGFKCKVCDSAFVRLSKEEVEDLIKKAKKEESIITIPAKSNPNKTI